MHQHFLEDFIDNSKVCRDKTQMSITYPDYKVIVCIIGNYNVTSTLLVIDGSTNDFTIGPTISTSCQHAHDRKGKTIFLSSQI